MAGAALELRKDREVLKLSYRIFHDANRGDTESKLRSIKLLIENFGEIPDKGKVLILLQRFARDPEVLVREALIPLLFQSIEWAMDTESVNGNRYIKKKAIRWPRCHIQSERTLCRKLLKISSALCQDYDYQVRLQLPIDIRNNMFGFRSIGLKADILHTLISDRKGIIRSTALETLSEIIHYLDDKKRKRAVDDFLRILDDPDPSSRMTAASFIYKVWDVIPDTQSAFNKLLGLLIAEERFPGWIFRGGTMALMRVVPLMKDIPGVWEDLFSIIQKTKDTRLTRKLLSVLRAAIPKHPDKVRLFDDLHTFCNNPDGEIRLQLVNALAETLYHGPENSVLSHKIWNDLVCLMHDDDPFVSNWVVISLRYIFPKVPDQIQAWNELMQGLKDSSGALFLDTEYTIFEILPQIPLMATRFLSTKNVLGIWKDLLFLTSSRAHYNRHRAAKILADVYPAHPDAESAWNDILQLTEPSYLTTHQHTRTPGDMSIIFEWDELDLQCIAYHTLGRISIYKATKAADDAAYLGYLKDGVSYFEKSLEKKPDGNPARFCSLFYHSLYSMVSGARDAEEEASRYLAHAKEVVDKEYPTDDDPESKQKKLKLLNAVTSLSSAFSKIYNTREIQLTLEQATIDIYRLHCEKMADLLDDVENTAPVASRAVWRTAFSIDKKVTASFSNLEDKSKQFCLKLQGTRYETIGKILYSDVKELGEKSKLEEIQQQLNQIESVTFSFGKLLYSQEEKTPLFERTTRSRSPLEQSEKIIETLMILWVRVVELKKSIDEKDKEINQLKNTICSQLEFIRSGINQVSTLQVNHNEWSKQIEKHLQAIPKIQEEISQIQSAQKETWNNQEINKHITILAESIEKIMIEHLSKEEKISQEFIIEIQNLKQNSADKWWNRFGALASIVSLILPHLGKLGI